MLQPQRTCHPPLHMSHGGLTCKASLMRTCWGLQVRPLLLLRRDTGEPNRVVVTPTCLLLHDSLPHNHHAWLPVPAFSWSPVLCNLADDPEKPFLPIVWCIHTFCLSYDHAPQIIHITATIMFSCKVQGRQRHVDKSYFASSGLFLYADLLEHLQLQLNCWAKV